MNTLNETPKIVSIDDVLTEAECQHFIDLAKPNLQRALVSMGKQGEVSVGRTGSNCWIPHNKDKITREVAERLAKLADMPLENAESFQVIHYGETQEYRPHYDSWEHDYSEKSLRCMRLGGARMRTALLYLNTPEEGGGTRFPRLKLTVDAKKGKLVIFDNTYSDSHIRHPLSEHAGMPVIKGEKYAFNLWFRECNSKKLYSEHNPAYYANK